MPLFICTACGTQYSENAQVPTHCVICEEERQYIPPRGQTWTTLQALRESHTNTFREYENGIIGIGSTPAFAIGQRALLVRTDIGNILWDCIALFDDATETLLRSLGGIEGIAISHPHYYTCMQDWARAFDCSIHLHAADAEWVMRGDPAIRHWQGETNEILKGVTLVRLGGHFPGGTVLHWADGADGRGALLSGDIVQVAADLNRVSFLWSYPNMMPLAGATVRRIADTLKPWPFDRIYGAFPGRQVMRDGARAVDRSAARYIELLQGGQA